MVNNKGQSLIGLIIVLVIAGLFTGVLYYYLSKKTEVPEISKKPVEEKKVAPPPGEELPEKIPKEAPPKEKPPEEVKPKITCQDECPSTGLKRCSDNGYQTCGNYDADPCLEWSSVTNCPTNTICQNGNCIQQKCADGTPYGQCSINKPKYCNNGNLVNKATLCGCPSNYEISGNQCIPITLPKTGREYWAVVFGTVGEEAVGLRGFNHLPLVLKDILIQHGWKEDHIKYFIGENATYTNVKAALDWLTNNTGPNDVVLFYSLTHGTSAGISLHDYFLEFTELGEKLDKIKYGGMVIIIDACYSGGAIPILKKENRVIITSTRSAEKGINDIFSKRLLAALQGFGDIEGNNNGWVSVEEAFKFVQRRYTGPQSQPWPQIQDNYPGELDIISLDDYWRYLDQFNIEKGTNSFTGTDYLGGNPLENELRIYAQSFKPSYPILTKVMLGVNFGNGNPGPLTVSIKKDLSGPNLTSATLNQNAIRPSSSAFYEFDFPDIKVIPDETYYLVISVSYTVKKDDYYNLWIDTTGGYSRGTMFFKGIRPSISWTDMPGVNLYFATFGKPE